MLFIILLLLFYYVVYYFIFLELQPQDLFQMIELRHKHESVDLVFQHRQYSVCGWFYLCSSVFWELRDNGIVTNL